MKVSILNSYLSKGNSLPILVAGNSMGGLFSKKTRVKIIKKKKYFLGDIIIFNEGKRFTAHRVIKKHPEFVVTKGDKISYCDREMSYDNILGKIIEIEDKSINSFYHRSKGFLIAILSRQQNNFHYLRSKWS